MVLLLPGAQHRTAKHHPQELRGGDGGAWGAGGPSGGTGEHSHARGVGGHAQGYLHTEGQQNIPVSAAVCRHHFRSNSTLNTSRVNLILTCVYLRLLI